MEILTFILLSAWVPYKLIKLIKFGSPTSCNRSGDAHDLSTCEPNHPLIFCLELSMATHLVCLNWNNRF